MAVGFRTLYGDTVAYKNGTPVVPRMGGYPKKLDYAETWFFLIGDMIFAVDSSGTAQYRCLWDDWCNAKKPKWIKLKEPKK